MNHFEPMLAMLSSLPDESSAYAFEVKWDGIRILACFDGKDLVLFTRNKHNVIDQYPEIAPLRQLLLDKKITDITLDGEIIALNANGRPSFSLLQKRFRKNMRSLSVNLKQVPIVYILFDILQLNGRPLVDLTYVKRRDILDSLQLQTSYCQIPRYQTGDGKTILEATQKLGLEGIVAKRLDSQYHAGKRTGDWLKIKNIHRQEFVVGGWLPGKGTRQGLIGSILVGYYAVAEKETVNHGPCQKLVYAGRVGTGFTTQMLRQLSATLVPLHSQENPFCNLPYTKHSSFVTPTIVIECEFTEWTPSRTLRHPVFKGFRFDKTAKDVVLEKTGE